MAHDAADLKGLGDLGAKYFSSMSELGDLNIATTSTQPLKSTSSQKSSLKKLSLNDFEVTNPSPASSFPPPPMSSSQKSLDAPGACHAPPPIVSSTPNPNVKDSSVKLSSLKDLSLKDFSVNSMQPSATAPPSGGGNTSKLSAPLYPPEYPVAPPAGAAPPPPAASAPPQYSQEYNFTVANAPEPSAPPATVHYEPPPTLQAQHSHDFQSYGGTNSSQYKHNAYMNNTPNYPPSNLHHAQNAPEQGQHYSPPFAVPPPPPPPPASLQPPTGYPVLSGAYNSVPQMYPVNAAAAPPPPAGYPVVSGVHNSVPYAYPDKENAMYGAAPADNRPVQNTSFDSTSYGAARPDNLPTQYATFVPGPPTATAVVPPVSAPTASAQTASAPVSTAAPAVPEVKNFPAVGGFKDMGSRIDPVAAARVTSGQEAANRLVLLKRKINELQRKRETYHNHLKGNAGGGAVAALITGGASLLVTAPTALHQRNRVQQVLKAMREIIGQINTIRNVYSHLPGWENAEKAVFIENRVFASGLKRSELRGQL